MLQTQFKQPSFILPGKQLEIAKTGLLADYFPGRQYALGQTGQQLIDFSGKGNHGVHGSGTGVDAGDPLQENNCLFYDSDDYTTLPLNVFSSLEGTFEVVFKTIDNYGGLRVLGSDHNAGNNSEMRTFVSSVNQFGLTLFNGNTSKTGRVLLFYGVNLTYTCTWKYNGNVTVITSYLNGKYQNVDTLLGQVIVPNVSLWMGRWNASYSRFKLYRGLFYGRGLSNYEVMDNYKIHKKELKEYGVVI